MMLYSTGLLLVATLFDLPKWFYAIILAVWCVEACKVFKDF